MLLTELHDKHVSDQMEGSGVGERGYVFSPQLSSEELVCAPLDRKPGNHLLSYTYTTVLFFPAQGPLADLTDGPHLF